MRCGALSSQISLLLLANATPYHGPLLAVIHSLPLLYLLSLQVQLHLSLRMPTHHIEQARTLQRNYSSNEVGLDPLPFHVYLSLMVDDSLVVRLHISGDNERR